MSSPPSLVWFVLLDSATGEPFEDTSASSILVSSLTVPVVDQFRKAVKAEYSNKLSSVDAGALLVYKNKAEFDKRNIQLAAERGKPLDPTEFLGTLGNKEDMLVVVAPSSFRSCEVPFYKSIRDATENDGWLRFSHGIPSTTLDTLYIRESYRKIESIITNKTVITGTPGIGKSLFLIYLLWNLVKNGKRVLFIYFPLNIYYDGKGGVYTIAWENLPVEDDFTFWNDTLWCLFDAKNKEQAHLHRIPYEMCRFIMSTSPRREMMNDFKKPPRPQTFYMPTWTEAELKAIAPLFPHAAEEWSYRFTVLGGVPRHVLEDTVENPTEMLERACKECSLDDCVKTVGVSSKITEKSKVVHLLVHVTSTDPYKQSSVCYASQTALNIIVRNKGIEAKQKMRQLLAYCHGNPLVAALCGYIFEPYAIELLEKGGPFRYRKLVHGNTKDIPAEGTLNIPSSIKEVVDKVEPNQTLNQLYVPKATNHPVIDAWIPGIGAFQMTVGKTHDIKGGASDDLAKLQKDGNKLYWLLPPLYYDTFTKKTPQDIDQYAMLIPYPE